MPDVQKAVRFDTGDLLQGSVGTTSNGEIVAYSNPAMGYGHETLSGNGYVDIARLDAFVLGETEDVVALNGAGATTLHWDRNTGAWSQSAWGETSLVGSQAVRSRKLPGLSLNVVCLLDADDTTAHVYRYGTGHFHLTDVVFGQNVLDIEIGFDTNNAVLLVARHASGLEARHLNGNLAWTASGIGGELVRTESGGGDIGWIRRDTSGGGWKYASITATGETVTDLSTAIPMAQNVLAAHLAHCDLDTDLDLVTKTAQQVVVVYGDSATTLDASTANIAHTYTAADMVETDISIDNGGQTISIVGSATAASPTWPVAAEHAQQARPVSGSSLEMTDCGLAGATNGTKLTMRVWLSWEELQRFSNSSNTATIEVLVRSAPHYASTVGDPIGNTRHYELQQPIGTPAQIAYDLPLVVGEALLSPGSISPYYWENDTHNFVTMRLLRKNNSTGLISRTGLPVTYGVSCAEDQQEIPSPADPYAGFDDLVAAATGSGIIRWHGPDGLPPLSGGGSGGDPGDGGCARTALYVGGVVGVTTEIDPPRTNGTQGAGDTSQVIVVPPSGSTGG
ncbi:MAG: hypothetical protein AB8H80_08165 [Planctomycetota bacterium]